MILLYLKIFECWLIIQIIQYSDKKTPLRIMRQNHEQSPPSHSHSHSNNGLSLPLIPIYEHLYQMYPCLPKYLNDPQQSQIIRTYALLLSRFTGIYGSQPKYFIRSPACINILGTTSKSIKFDMLTACALQNMIVAVNVNGSQFIRVNHHQNAVYGEKVIKWDGNTFKYTNSNTSQGQSGTSMMDQYSMLLIACLKVYVNMIPTNQNSNNNSNNNNGNILPGLDILLYDDFIQDQHMAWRQALCLGIVTAVHYAINGNGNKNSNTNTNNKNNTKNELNYAFYTKFANKISTILNLDRFSLFSLGGQYSHMSIINNPTLNTNNSNSNNNNKQLINNNQIQFPQQIDIIIAHSMTPLPKKMITGKRQNLRMCEIQLGIEIIKSELGATNTLSSLQQLKQYLNCTNYQQLLQTIDEHVPKNQLSSQQIQSLTSQSMIQLLKSVPFANAVIDYNAVYHPYKRMRFYVEEIIQIQKIKEKEKQKMKAKKSVEQQNNKIESHKQEFKQNEGIVKAILKSYQNSKQLLQIGSQQFDQMIKIIENQSLAYKILGDGWGGNLLILSPKTQSQTIIEKLITQFYLSPENRVLLSDDIQQYVRIVGQPGTGLCVLDPQSQIWFC